jgi:thioester reductase-like protein
MTAYFLTGATGFLGREVLVRLLHMGADVLVLTRRRDEEAISDAHARLAAIIERSSAGTPLERLTVAFGDVTSPDLALGDEAKRWLNRADDRIQLVHGAAEVRFDLPWPVMHAQNVEGTRHVIDLAKRLSIERRLRRLDHVSTAFIAGDRTDLAREQEIDEGQKPRNGYERSKLEAEVEIDRARKEGLPITVLRPSIIVGDSRTGRASSFKVLYWPMKVYARGRWKTMFGRPTCNIDVVPVDFVADAMVHLFDTEGALGKTVHLAAGMEQQSTIGELAAIVEQIFERGRVRYVDPDLYMRWLRPVVRPMLALLRPEVAERGGVYLPYFKSNPSFSVDEAMRLLAPASLRPPPVAEYFGRIVAYAKETDFGAVTSPTDRPADS